MKLQSIILLSLTLTIFLLNGEQGDRSQLMESEKPFPFSGQNVLKCYYRAYPEKVDTVAIRNGDWAISIYKRWFTWSEGKLIPVDKEGDTVYAPYPFYPYPTKLGDFIPPSPDEKRRLDRLIIDRKTNPLERDPSFLNTMWRIHDKKTSWTRMKTLYFMGFKVQIHRDLLEDLAAVEEDLQKRMLVDGNLKDFMKKIGRIDAYNWRKIAGTNTLSVHSYGLALDLILNDYNNKEIYWRWTMNKGEIWYDTSYKERFSPPESIIKAFEDHGFIWGGKWLFFDTIHFEYRPEILLLNGIGN